MRLRKRCALLLVPFLAAGCGGGSPKQSSMIVGGPATSWKSGARKAPAFHLVDQNGRAVTLAAYRGRAVVVTFLDPLCRNYCPVEATRLGDVVRSLAPHGVRKFVVLNGHGGNDFRQMLRELQPATPAFLCALNWYTCVDPTPYFDEPGDHAGELETSIMMALVPELVHPLVEAGAGTARRFRLAGLRDGWVWAQRRWSRVTEDTGVGNPAGATAEKGRRYFSAVCQRIAGFLVELAQADPEAMYE